MNFFFDRCVPKPLSEIAQIVSRRKIPIVHHDAEFRQDTTDPDWMAAIGQRTPKPIVITGDGRILKRPDELRVLIEQDLTFVCLAPKWMEWPFEEQVWKFARIWPDIVKEVAKCKQATVFQVSCGSSQKIETVQFTKDLKSRLQGK